MKTTFTQCLSYREREIIILRFCDSKRNLEEIGKRFHITKERVRQIETKAIRKLIENLLKFEGVYKTSLLEDN